MPVGLLHTRSHIRSRRGVGLIEFMVAAILVCLVATVAIPQYLHMRRQAMRAEPAPYLRSISVAQQAWFVAEGSWLPLSPNPSPPVGRTAVYFDLERADWQRLGWHPDGPVRCSYSATVLDATTHARAEALCDLDGDREVAILRYEIPAGDQPGTMLDLYPERF